MFAGYILKKTASGTTSYIVESPSGGIGKTTDKDKATIFPSRAKIKKVKEHAPKKTSGFMIEELSKPESNPGVISDPIPMPAQHVKEIQSEDMSKRIVFPQETRMSVYNQSEGRCVYCGRFIPFDEMTIDHIVPLSKGGTNYEKNLQCCCKECNLMKQDLLECDFYKKMKEILKNQKNKKIRDKTQTLRGVYRKTCIVCNKDVFQDVNP